MTRPRRSDGHTLPTAVLLGLASSKERRGKLYTYDLQPQHTHQPLRRQKEQKTDSRSKNAQSCVFFRWLRTLRFFAPTVQNLQLVGLIAACPSHLKLELQIQTLQTQHPWLSFLVNHATPFYPQPPLVTSPISPLAKVNSSSIRGLPVVRFFPQGFDRLATHRRPRLPPTS